MIIGADSTDTGDMNTGSNAFWEYSLSLYGAPGVAPACIELQDRHGLDVNLLLWCCWRAQCGHDLAVQEVSEMDAVVRGWREDVVLPLRALRRGLREYPGIDATRAHLKAAELEAEKTQQARMFELSSAVSGVPLPVAANLATLAACLSLPEAVFDDFCERVAQARA